MKRKMVYIAGPYTASSSVAVIDNIRAGLRSATVLMMNGVTPFCPFVDFLFGLMLQDDEKLSIDEYYESTLEGMRRSDAILLLPGWEKSEGVMNELTVSMDHSIPAFVSIGDLMKFLELGVEMNTKTEDAVARLDRLERELLEIAWVDALAVCEIVHEKITHELARKEKEKEDEMEYREWLETQPKCSSPNG